MKRTELEEGEVYVATSSRELYGYRAWDIKRVLVVDSKSYHARSTSAVPRNYVARDKAYVKAHLAWALTQAFPKDTTPNEANTTGQAVREAQRTATARYFAEDPMRKFQLGGSRYDNTGVLVRRYLTQTNTWGPLELMATRELRLKWTEYEAEKERRDRAEAESRRVAMVRKAELDAQREVVNKLLVAVFGENAPVVPGYRDHVLLSFAQATELLQKASA